MTPDHDEAPHHDEGRDRRTPRRVAVLWWAAIALVLWGIDQGTKVWALNNLDWGEPEPFIGRLLQWHLIANPGAAFSLGAGHTWIFTLLSLGVLAFIIVTARRLRHRGWAVALGLITAGILGNVTDRLIREPGFAVGHVIDFLQLPNWPIFNVADMCVTFGAITLIVVWFRTGLGPDGLPDQSDRDAKTPRRTKDEPEAPDTSDRPLNPSDRKGAAAQTPDGTDTPTAAGERDD